MTDKDRPEFMARLAALMEIHGKESTVSLVDSYWAALRDMSLAAFQEATERALRESRFFPKPAELRDFVGAGEAQKKMNAALSWEIVRLAMDRYDYVQTVDFGPLSNAVIRNMGGWAWLCDRTKTDLTFDRKKFEDLHAAMAGAEINTGRGAPLIGAYYANAIRFQVPGEPSTMRRTALPEQESPGLQLVRELAQKKGA